MNNDIVPTEVLARPGSTATATFTDGAYLLVKIHASYIGYDYKLLTPVECFTNLEWSLVEQGAQVLTTAYGSNPITFLPNVAFPTSFEVADLGTAVPDGSYEFLLTVIENNSGKGPDASGLTINIQKCSDMASVSVSPTIADFTAYWKGANSNIALTSALSTVATNSIDGGIVDPTCYS